MLSQATRLKFLAIMLLAFGGFQLVRAWTYSDAAKREASTIGTITSVHHGGKGGPTYFYEFEVKGVKVADASTSRCKTPVPPSGCREGGLVRVYYDTNDTSESLLEEFGAASRYRFVAGASMTGIGLLIGGFQFLKNKTSNGQSGSSDSDDSNLKSESEVPHIVPGE
jgi:hypothetical protein